MGRLRFQSWLVGLLVLVTAVVRAIPVDNNVDGEPEITCGADAIEINFKTTNPFNGRLYVKGRYDQGDCRNEQVGRKFTGITLSFEICGVMRLRSLNPRGIFASTTIVISFHPFFVTKVDRVYKIQCFYMEADKTVRNQLDVSEMTTAMVTHNVPMPVCRYDILDGGPQGQPVKFATIGQQVYHQWKCDSETTNTFCMKVHSCKVDDERGVAVPMLDEEGCSLDKYVLSNLEYPEDLTAGQEAHVFKFADRPALFFQCQIAITLKEVGAECPRPECKAPPRKKRTIDG
ncbi:hypothetical protein L596_026991 [Steinernema carpocapsae]|nr:hypothetical protein L596_026991 [Steinernema carpocapsae]